MKNLSLLFIILFLLSFNIAEAQTPTDAGIPDAYHVLVVYKHPTDQNDSLGLVSQAVKNYYQEKRGIPQSNIVPLTLPDSVEITIDNETHWVGLAQQTDIIRDFYQDATWAGDPTKHAFKYFLDNISTPIRNWISSHNLTSTIRYIVLCKGVPFKIQSGGDWCCYVQGNLTVDGLLCMLNTPDYDSYLLNTVLYDNNLSNPYKNVDPNLTMEYRFLPDHFNTSEYNLSYLVSHLDGISYDVVKGIIDKSLEPDISGTAAWVIDDDPTYPGSFLHNDFTNAKDKLGELGFNVVYNESDTWITSQVSDVIGYTSWGTHAEDGNCEWEDSAWVKDSLHFNLANGSVFNTFESFNGNSLTTLNWRYVPNDPSSNCNHTQGLATQFTEIGGTGTMGHAWEPTGGVVSNGIFFPAYQMGYNLVDAFYQGLSSLASQNVLVGDPLVRIYECENTVITTNTTIGDGDYDCNVTVPLNVTLTIESGSTINLNRNASLKIYGTLELGNNTNINFNGYSNMIIDSSGSIFGYPNSLLTFNDHAIFQLDCVKQLSGNTSFTFNDNSSFIINGELNVNGTDVLDFNDKAMGLVYGRLFLPAGSRINFYQESKLNIYGKLISIGESSNNVILNSSDPNKTRIFFIEGDSLFIDYTTLTAGGLVGQYYLSDDPLRCFTIKNSKFTNSVNGINFQTNGNPMETVPTISNCVFNVVGTGLYLVMIPEINIENDSIIFHSPTPSGIGIYLSRNGIVNISDCKIMGGELGIKSYSSSHPVNSLEADLSIFNCEINSKTGISFDVNTTNTPVVSLEIQDNIFSQCVNGIILNRFNTYMPVIKGNTIMGIDDETVAMGLSLTNGNEILISGNSILNFLTGISLNIVNAPYIKENIISAIDLSTVEPLSGLVAVSSHGQIGKNTIQYHKNGIELGSSSPKIGANIITDNNYYGIYISGNSHPDLSHTYVWEEEYPLSGYNTIRENGLCAQMNFSELYILESTINLEKGCNTIADDREEQLSCGYFYLMDGEGLDYEIQANQNYWGEINHSNPMGRFGEGITVNYNDWLEDPCTYGQGETELILANSKGVVYDTVYSTGITATGLNDIETRYATANNYYYSNQFTQANQEYLGIIQNYGNNRGSLQAYNRIYTIANLTINTPGEFNQLKDFYLQKANNQSDSVMIGALTHLSDLCLISAEEYITAINKFDEIAQQNPNTDIALYRQIDALTTSLLSGQDSTMNKGSLVKYRVNDITEYNNKLSELLKTRGKSGLESGEEIMPTEYTLYQNYPNPFNPVTTIKYDLPSATDVSLVIYDILGRKVKELVNTKQQVGRYEIQFNASNLASGIYIYQLVAEKFISSKKMILLK